MYHDPLRLTYRHYASVFWLIAVLATIGCGKTPNTEPDPPELKPIYTAGTLIYLDVEEYTYIAHITADTFPDATEVPIEIFVPHLQKELGDTLPLQKVKRVREAPETGWNTRLVAAEYFDGTQWQFEWNIKEMEDHYLLPETFQGVRRVEFSNIRFPIPIQR